MDSKPTWDDLRDEAAKWLAGMDSGSLDPKDFEIWRDADPRHAAAFAQVAGALMTLDRHKADLKTEVPPVKPQGRRNFLLGGIWAVGLAGVGAGVFAVSQARATVRTGVGQQKRVALPGGGWVQLNTDTEIQWRVHDRITEIWLKRGEVAISAPMSSLVFHAAGHTAAIQGGGINARLRGAMLDLASTGGTIRLQKTSEARAAPGADIIKPNTALLLASDQAVVRPLSATDIAYLSGWPQGELVFQGQTLEMAVAEYNRYLSRKIYIADPSLAGIRLGGRFTSHDPQLFLRALHDGFDIQVNDSGAGTIILTK